MPDTEEILFDISELAYDLYKQDWIDQHTTPATRQKAILDYYNYVQECLEDEIDPDSFEEYLEEYGYDNSSLYVCYDEFIDAEYMDESYITNLLKGHPALIAAYKEDLAEIMCDDDDDDDDDFDDECWEDD